MRNSKGHREVRWERERGKSRGNGKRKHRNFEAHRGPASPKATV